MGGRCLAILVTFVAVAGPLYADDGRWHQREFVIGGWLAGDTRQPGRLPAFYEAGLNRVVNGDRDDRFDVTMTARAADSLTSAIPGFDMRLFASYRVAPPEERVLFNPSARVHPGAVARVTDPVRGLNRKCIDGWLVWDEPVTERDFDAIGQTIALLDSLPATRSQLAFVNLLSAYASGQARYDSLYGADKLIAYRRYLDRALTMYRRAGVPVPLLSVDHYPFQTAVHHDDYFFTLATMRAAAAAVSDTAPPPLWVTVQLAPLRDRDGHYRSEPTFDQVRWQVSIALAYGAKGILYWTLSPSGPGEYGPGLLDRGGNRTANFASIAALDRVLRAWGPWLMRLTPIATFHQSTAGARGIDTESLAGGASSPVVAAVAGGDDQGLVGLLHDRAAAEDWLMVVNKSLTGPEAFAITLARDVAGVDVIDDQGKVHAVPVTARRFSVPALPPGGAALYRLRAR
jgi:hypothetical protein